MSTLLRYAAFTHGSNSEGTSGNPAGVVLDAAGMDTAQMQSIAAEVGYSETVFLIALGADRYRARYFSPRIEVPFCGHATIASAVALFDQKNLSFPIFETAIGDVPITVREDANGPIATLTSVTPRIDDAPPELLTATLAALRWNADELDHMLPPRVAFAGARHLVLAAATRARLSDLDYDVDALERIMRAHNLTTVDLVWRETQILFHARNPFPVGGVVEDPATGAAAAAFGGYLRALGLVPLPAEVTIVQGEDMGRPSRIVIGIDRDRTAGIRVSGHARQIDEPSAAMSDVFRIAPHSDITQDPNR
jgi:PhzF family phenazine biosynthesis protein